MHELAMYAIGMLNVGENDVVFTAGETARTCFLGLNLGLRLPLLFWFEHTCKLD